MTMRSAKPKATKFFIDQAIDNLKKIAPEWSFSGVRVLLLVHRGKHGSNEANRNHAMYVSTNEEEFLQLYALLLQKQAESKIDMRIYTTVNSRSLKSAVRKFKNRQLDVDYDGEEYQEIFYKNIKANFISCLMLPASRDSKFFKLDVDRPKSKNRDARTDVVTITVEKLKEVLGDLVLMVYDTPNGAHVITNPFNPKLIEDIEHVTFEKDGLFLLNKGPSES